MAGVEIEEDYLHDAIIDLAASRGVGVNGLNVGDVSVSEGTVRFSLSSPFKWKRSPVIVFRQTTPARRYHVSVNGAEAGSWSGEELEKGIPWPFERRL
jgi:hypothetical protein